MYSFDWDNRTGGYCLTTRTAKTIASEIRPVFAEELRLTGMDAKLSFAPAETRPLLWAKQNVYLYRSKEIAKMRKTQYGNPLDIEWFFEKKRKLVPVDIATMLEKNRAAMAALVSDTLKRIKEMYDAYAGRCDAVYIGFSGGKDSVALLDLCHKVLPLDVPVVFSDTDMELPDTYCVWEEVQARYPDRPFIKARANRPALENWRLFGPPSRSVRWCCAVHKSAPALIELKERLGKNSITAAAFIGVRGEESLNRAGYDDIGEGVKNSSQTNLMPILNWSAHELWLYIFENDLSINPAYRYGLARVGCIMCPESSEKYAWFVDAVYPQVMKPFEDAVIETNAKHFENAEEAKEFIGSANWQARKSGVALKEHLARPEEKWDGLSVEFSCGNGAALREWAKTIDPHRLSSFLIDSCRMTAVFADEAQKRVMLPALRSVANKAVACVGCQSCEAECPVGALRVLECGNKLPHSKITINEAKCIHCLQCHSADLGCWRYRSMRTPETSNNSGLNGINVYKNFGLRREFLSIYLEEKEEFTETTRLNREKQVPAAKTWFRQGLLMDAKTCVPTKLLELFEQRGIEDALAWDCVWLGLCNHAAIVKWLVSALELDVPYSDEQLFALLGTDIKDVTKKGGLQALKNMLVSTPFGAGDGSVCELVKKGAHTVGIIRRAREIEPLTTLYGLYVIAEKAGRGTFTVRQLMEKPEVAGDGFESAFVSPLIAFGMSPDMFKKQVLGLAAQYSDLIGCSLTLGLDEIRVFSETKTKDDVVGIIMKA